MLFRSSSGVMYLDDPPPAVPVPVLEALASAWEDQAGKTFAGSAIEVRIGTLRDCARMLREAITHGGQG